MQIDRAEPQSRGVSGSFVALLMTAFAPEPATAGSPYLTEDPGVPSTRWELHLGATYERNRAQDVVTGPMLDINYTAAPNVQFGLTLQPQFISDRHLHTDLRDLADTDLRMKVRFVDEDPDGWRPAVSIAPGMILPTGKRESGTGDGTFKPRLPVQVGKNFGPVYAYASVGYQWGLRRDVSDEIQAGVAVEWALDERWTIGSELYSVTPTDTTDEFQLLANLGASYRISDGVQVQATLGRTLRNPQREGPLVLSQIVLQLAF